MQMCRDKYVHVWGGWDGRGAMHELYDQNTRAEEGGRGEGGKDTGLVLLIVVAVV